MKDSSEDPFVAANLLLTKRTLEQGGNIVIMAPSHQAGQQYISQFIGNFPSLAGLAKNINILLPEDLLEED